jgi:NADPH:quinone reductase-like Zn-dependent oxidoreductase
MTPFEIALRTLQAVGVSSGQALLVSAAAGGVDSAVVQIARERGVAVIGIASPWNQEPLTSLGARATAYGEGFVERCARSRAECPRASMRRSTSRACDSVTAPVPEQA